MFQRIAVGTDGSDTASVAVAHAAELAGRTGAELLVVHAYSEGRARGESPFGPPQDPAAAEAGRSVLAHEESKHGGRVRMRTVLGEGNPAEVLLDVAEGEDVDVVAVGNVGMTGARRFVMGSVPNNVAHHAPCHVLIVNTAWAARAAASEVDAAPLYATVLMATDGSPTAERAVEVGAGLARAVGANVTLLHVGDPQRGDQLLEPLAERLGDGLAIETSTVEGHPAQTIVEVAEREDADIIVVGNKGMTGGKRFLLGSVPNSVAHHASCNVFIARTT